MEAGKIGLALGGGAARGWAHIGVIQALHDAGIVPDIVAGTSIGAVVGGCFSAGHLMELEGFARSLTRRRIFGYLDLNLSGTGLITGQRLNDTLKKTIGDRSFEDLPVKFTAVATEIGTGHEIWLSRGHLVEAIRASYALPGIFKPVKVNGRWLFDGALVNPVPISVCRALGARYVIAVNLNFDLTSRGTMAPQFDLEQATDGLPSTTFAADDAVDADGVGETAPSGVAARRLLRRQMFGKGENAPGISTVMVDAFNIVQDRIARSRLAGDPPDAMISPKLHGIGLFDFHLADDLIRYGRVAAERELDTIRQEIAVRRDAGLIRSGAA